MTIEDLYTANDLKRIREKLLEEQQGLDLLTGLEIPKGKSVTDHVHNSECFVRGILHRNVNSALGRIENTYIRDLSWWYEFDLPTFLRQTANYLELEAKPYRHPSFLKSLKVQFNKLTSRQQDQVLVQLGSDSGKNLKERKEKFSKVILNRSLGYDKIREVINQVKES